MQTEFPALACGDTALRYIIISKDVSGLCTVLPHCDWTTYELSSLPANCVPLFIAADMWEFMGGNSASNNTRFLNKMQSLKLSTKLNIEGVKIEGTHNSKLLHCFTVQAVFMVLFKETDNESKRISIARSLWNLWTRYGTNNDLPPDIHYRYKTILSPAPHPASGEETLSDKQHTVTKPVETDTNLSLLDHLLQKFDVLKQSHLSYMHTLRSLLDSYRKVETQFGECGLKIVLDQHLQLTQGTLTCSGKTDSDSQPCAAGNTDANVDLAAGKPESKLSSCMLTSTSKWLAMSFVRLHPQVKHRANKFKQDNIQSVDNLPAPKDLCSTLFPRAMVLFFEEWLSATHNDMTSRDDTSSSRKKMKRTVQDYRNSNIYPFILLILEFANNCLVSGVAHVLFTRLILDQPDSVTVR